MEPEAELRQRYLINSDGTIGEDSTPKWVRNAIFAKIQKPKYSNIHGPLLAILAVPLPLDEQFKKYQPRTADEQAAMAQKYAVGEAFTKRTVQDLKAGDSNAQIVMLPGASTYVFLANENSNRTTLNCARIIARILNQRCGFQTVEIRLFHKFRFVSIRNRTMSVMAMFRLLPCQAVAGAVRNVGSA